MSFVYVIKYRPYIKTQFYDIRQVVIRVYSFDGKLYF
jgi:hypothetical protein